MNFASSIDAAAKTYRVTRKTWFEMLSTEAQKELLAVRKKFQDGGYPVKRYSLARIICANAKERGWVVCDRRQMHEWLANKD